MEAEQERDRHGSRRISGGYYACKGDYVANNKGVRVAKCPIGREYCYPSCRWRKGNRCYYRSKRGRQIAELKKKGNN